MRFGRPLCSTRNDGFARSSTTTMGRVETDGGRRPCRITGESLRPAMTGRWRFFSKADVGRDRSPASSHSLGDVNLRARRAALWRHVHWSIVRRRQYPARMRRLSLQWKSPLRVLTEGQAVAGVTFARSMSSLTNLWCSRPHLDSLNLIADGFAIRRCWRGKGMCRRGSLDTTAFRS